MNLSHRSLWLSALAALLLAECVSTPVASGQEPAKQDPKAQSPAFGPRGKKLVLKDGNFHVVRSWELKGDRVRFYSLEWSNWEEIPADLVDWDATRKAEAETEAKRQELLEKSKAAEQTALAREVDVDASIEILPGLFMPDNEGLYVLEDKLLLPLSQVTADLKRDKGRTLTQVLVPIPVIPTRHRVQIQGKQAVLRITTPQPEFYFRAPDAREPEMQLIRAKIKDDSREIQVIDTLIAGEQLTKSDFISTQRWKIARGVYRFTVSQPLEPGEYVLAEFLPGEGMNVFVWDFGVDLPKAKETKK